MAFTDAQRNAIMTYLGYPAISAGTRYAAYYPVYAQIDLIGQDAVTQTPVAAILTELAALDIALATAGSTTATYGALKKVDEVEFYSPAEGGSGAESLGSLKRARMLVRRLAQRMGGEHFIVADYFGSGGIVSSALALG